MTYYVRQNDGRTGKVELRLIVKTGYLAEKRKEINLSHVLEHVAFGKSSRFSNIANFLKSNSLIPGEDFNAHTG
ncbi:insulinase family protein, partial [Dawidia cretensis]|uniref:insulinase family protein n=1 Tax=Dawidia cretensis TaxID=2782350 RepID=UPI0034DABCD4